MPEIGRWITPDPLGTVDGPNLYAYAHDSPLNEIDEYGLTGKGFLSDPSPFNATRNLRERQESHTWSHNDLLRDSPRSHESKDRSARDLSEKLGVLDYRICANHYLDYRKAQSFSAAQFNLSATSNSLATTGISVLAEKLHWLTKGFTFDSDGLVENLDWRDKSILQMCNGGANFTSFIVGECASIASVYEAAVVLLGPLAGRVTAHISARIASRQLTIAAKSAESFAARRAAAGIACNRALFERYKVVLRSQMEKPHATDAALQRILTDMYRPSATVGSGSTAAAIRLEKMTGQQVKGRWHSQKAQEMVIRLEKWLRKNPTARPADRAAAENVLLDTLDALGPQ